MASHSSHSNHETEHSRHIDSSDAHKSGDGKRTASKSRETTPKGDVTHQKAPTTKRRSLAAERAAMEDPAMWLLEQQRRIKDEYAQRLKAHKLQEITKELGFEEEAHSEDKNEDEWSDKTPDSASPEGQEDATEEEARSKTQVKGSYVRHTSRADSDDELTKPYQPKRARDDIDLTVPYKPAALLKHSKFTKRIARAPIPPKSKCLITWGNMMEKLTQMISFKDFIPREVWNNGPCLYGATCSHNV